MVTFNNTLVDCTIAPESTLADAGVAGAGVGFQRGPVLESSFANSMISIDPPRLHHHRRSSTYPLLLHCRLGDSRQLASSHLAQDLEWPLRPADSGRNWHPSHRSGKSQFNRTISFLHYLDVGAPLYCYELCHTARAGARLQERLGA